MSLNLGLSNVSSRWNPEYAFPGNSHGGVVPHSWHHIKERVALTHFITADVRFDSLGHVMSARFLHCKVIIFLLRN